MLAEKLLWSCTTDSENKNANKITLSKLTYMKIKHGGSFL